MRWIHAPSELVAFALLAAGCSDRLAAPIGQPGDSPPQRGGTISIATFVDVHSIDPATAFDEGAEPIQRLVFARMLRISRTGQFEGDIAQSWQVSESGLRVTFRLREGVRFHDGTELTASDVKRSFERALHPKTPCPVPSFYDRIAGYEEFHGGKTPHLDGIRVTSEHEVVFDLREPDSTFLALMTLPVASPVCASAGDQYDPAFSSKACGAGPFRLARWDEQEGLELVRHDGYFVPGLPYVDAIRWKILVAPSVQRYRFERGELDFLHDLSQADSVAFRADPRWRELGAWTGSRATKGFFMNTEMPPFDRVPLRRAAAAAIDRESLDGLRGGHILPQNQMVPSGVLGHDPTFPGQHYDPKAALGWMADAGFPYDPSTGKGGCPEVIDYLVPAESYDLQIGELLQQQLARVGIRIRLKAVSWGAYLSLTGFRRRVRMGAESWGADFDDPSDFFEPILSSRSIQDERSQNRAFFANKELDDLLDQARRELDEGKRKALYRRADEIVRDEAPWAIVYGYRHYDVWQGYVRGYRPHPMVYQDIGFVWLDRAQKRGTIAERTGPMLGMQALAMQLARGVRR